MSQWPAHFGRRQSGFDPKNVRTPAHLIDVVHRGRLGADDVDGVYESFIDGKVEGFDDDEVKVKGSQIGLAFSLLFPFACVLK